jgi:hypothetical protein
MGASGNFLTAVGRVTSRGAMVKEIAVSGDTAYNEKPVTGDSLMVLREPLPSRQFSSFGVCVGAAAVGASLRFLMR